MAQESSEAIKKSVQMLSRAGGGDKAEAVEGGTWRGVAHRVAQAELQAEGKWEGGAIGREV